MDQIQRAAIVLLGIGADNAAEVLKHLDHKQVQRITEAMSQLGAINPEEIQTSIQAFINDAEQQSELALGATEYVKETLVKALGKEKASSFINKILPGGADSSLESLRWMPPAIIAEMIREEHPQVIAVAMSYLEPEQAAEVLTYFNEEQRVDALVRVASLKNVSPHALDELNNVLEKQVLAKSPSSQIATLGGIKSAADILNAIESDLEGQVMDGLKCYDSDLANKIQEQMFVFDDILKIDDRGIKTLLKEVPGDVLVLALKGSDEEVKEKVFNNMSKRAVELLRDDLESKGPVRLSEVEAAQKEIIVNIRRLIESGEIIMPGRGEKFV